MSKTEQIVDADNAILLKGTSVKYSARHRPEVAHYDEVRITNSSENIDDRPKEI
jgi:hypothetical protein